MRIVPCWVSWEDLVKKNELLDAEIAEYLKMGLQPYKLDRQKEIQPANIWPDHCSCHEYNRLLHCLEEAHQAEEQQQEQVIKKLNEIQKEGYNCWKYFVKPKSCEEFYGLLFKVADIEGFNPEIYTDIANINAKRDVAFAKDHGKATINKVDRLFVTCYSSGFAAPE